MLVALFALAFPFLCIAQAQTYTAAHLDFTHLLPFTQQQLEDAANLHPGVTFTTADLATAAKRLADTGYFDSVSATLEGKFSAAPPPRRCIPQRAA